MRPYARQMRIWGRGLRVGLALFAVLGRCLGSPLTINVQLPNGRPVAGAVITARPAAGPTHPAPALQAVMDQVNRAFVPDLLVVPVDSTVSFPNSDSVSHQIYSFSPAKRFQLPLYHGKPYSPVRFDQPGLVTLGCNIHDEMLAYVVVTDAPLFGRTAPDGSWSADVPKGVYHMTVWHPRLREEAQTLESDVTVAETGGTVTVRLRKLLKPIPLEGRPHSWDY